MILFVLQVDSLSDFAFMTISTLHKVHDLITLNDGLDREKHGKFSLLHPWTCIKFLII